MVVNNVDAQGANFDVCVVGLGYVGLTLAIALCDVGLKVLGIEQNAQIVADLQRGKPHFSEVGIEPALQRVLKSDLFVVNNKFESTHASKYYIITVGTPLNDKGEPRLDFIERAAKEVYAQIKPEDTVIVRSTVSIGTTNNVIKKILNKKNISFNLAMCPERTLEGNAMQELRQLPQIIGSDDLKSQEACEKLFKLLTNTTVAVSSCEAAEVIKLADNTYRDVTFAFGNEIARICEAVGVGANEVIRAGKFGYSRNNIAMPGLVGGPCLEKDPHILMHSVRNYGLDIEISKAARLVNERLPGEIVAQIKELSRDRFNADGTRIVLAGLAFKGVPATDDIRGSMGLKVLEHLRIEFNRPSISLFDPVIDPETMSSLFSQYAICNSFEEALATADILIIANNHPALGQYHPRDMREKMNKKAFIFDVWNHFSNLDNIKYLDFYYPFGSVNFLS